MNCQRLLVAVLVSFCAVTVWAENRHYNPDEKRYVGEDVDSAGYQRGVREDDISARVAAYPGDGYGERLDEVAAERLANPQKRRYCRHNYVYNPVSGRCQASLLALRKGRSVDAARSA